MPINRRANVCGLLLVAAAVALAACSDQQPLLGPEDDASLSDGPAPTTVNAIVVLSDRFVPGDREANRARAATIAEDLGVEVRLTYGSALFGFAGSVPEGRLNALRAHPLVAYVELDGVVSIPPTVSHHDPSHGGGRKPSPDPQVTPWGVHRIGVPESGATGAGVSVYIIDSGIDAMHPDLQANLGEGYAPRLCEGTCYEPWHDDQGHGTHVAGTVGALDNEIGVVGVAPNVTLHAVKVLGNRGTGWRSDVIAGLDWVAAHNPGSARVANMSIVGTGERMGACTLDGYEGEPNAYHESVCNARNLGVVIVAAAGNAGANAAYTSAAAFYDAVITVSAVACGSANWGEPEERCEEGTEGWASWSNWGVRQDEAWPSRNSLPVLIGSPGVRVTSTVLGGGIGSMSGTSMASPHVAGAVALLLENASYPADASAFMSVRQTLLDHAECTSTWDNTTGNPHYESFLNLQSATGDCAPPPEPPPAPEAPTGLVATAISSDAIHLTWAYEEPVPADIDFQVSRLFDSGWGLSPLLGSALSFTDTGLSPETTFTYRVRAVRGGIDSEWSPEASATTHAVPDDPHFEATFVYACSKELCDFEADHRSSTAYYTWDFGHEVLDEQQGAWEAASVFPSAGQFGVKLTVREGITETTESRVVACSLRGRNLFCQ